MIASEAWLTPTRATGMVVYGAAMVCCGMVWAKCRGRSAISQLAALLAAIEGALLLDMIFNWRWRLHGQLMDLAQRWNEYDLRRSPQRIAIFVLMIFFAVGVITALRVFRGRSGALLAVFGVLLSIVLWCTEVVSLHALDHVLYHFLGPLMLVSLVWIFAGLATSVGILIDARQLHAAP
jgi:hypothetical protein